MTGEVKVKWLGFGRIIINDYVYNRCKDDEDFMQPSTAHHYKNRKRVAILEENTGVRPQDVYDETVYC